MSPLKMIAHYCSAHGYLPPSKPEDRLAIAPGTKYTQASVLALLGAGLGCYFAGVLRLFGGAIAGFLGGLGLIWFMTPRWRGRGPVPPGHWR
jgi:hypothetical protein